MRAMTQLFRSARKHNLIKILMLLSLATTVHAQSVNKTGTSAAAFLRIPVGAKSIAMGGAFTATADDGSALFWNPGNTASFSKMTLFLDHSPWLPGIQYNYAGFLLPVKGAGVFGVNVVSLASDAMDVTTLDAQMGTGETFTAASTAAGLSYARQLTDRFSIGGVVKYVQERIWHSTANGFAFDVGTMFVTPFDDIRFGMSVSNVGTQMQMSGEDLNTYTDVAPNQEGNNDNIVSQFKTDQYNMPIIMRLGLAWDLQISSGTRMTFAADGVNPNDNSHSINLGVELATLNEILELRGGFNELFLVDREKGLTLGAGIHLPPTSNFDLSFSYAYQNFEHFSAVHHFSIETRFQP